MSALGPASPIRVVIADDHPVVRDGLSVLLGLLSDVVVVGKAADGEAAVEVVLRTRPDVVLMDLRMPRLSGVGAIRRIAAEHPEIGIVVLTTYADDEEAQAAYEAGALGYLTKDAEHNQIHQALIRAAAGHAQQERPPVRLAAEHAVPVRASLTPREADVLRLIAAGRSNREIMDALHVSEATVKTHINRIFAKTRVRDRAQAVRYAYLNGLAPSD